MTDDMRYSFEKDVEEDPYDIGQHEPGAKLDLGKPDCSLLQYFGRGLLAVAEVGTYGARKYTRGGWQSVPDGFNRYSAAMLRHYFAEQSSEMDDDLPVLHAAQVAWNALARLELLLREKEEICKVPQVSELEVIPLEKDTLVLHGEDVLTPESTGYVFLRKKSSSSGTKDTNSDEPCPTPTVPMKARFMK